MVKLLFSALLLALALTLSHALMRSAANYPPLKADWIIRTGCALALYGAVFFTYATLLRHLNLSTIYPIYTGLSILGVFLIGTLYFGESFTPQKIIGAITIVVGVVLLSK